MLPSDPTLRRWYLKYNDLYFDSKLPFDVTVYWEPPEGNLGQTMELQTLEETGGTPDLAIRLDPGIRFSKCLYRMTLLHEMVHIKLYPDLSHGKRFQKEMLRLANLGAFKGLW